ncbi:unnamed protein product, partial [Discosporangium mesarthrocarpum]
LTLPSKAEERRKKAFFDKQEAHEEKRREGLMRSEEEKQLLARQRFLQERKRMMILSESRAEEQARKEAGLARIEQARTALTLNLTPLLTLTLNPAEEEYLQQLMEKRARERRIQRERNELQKQLKASFIIIIIIIIIITAASASASILPSPLSSEMENVDRIQRIQEYKRLETLRQIHEADKRTTEMVKKREAIIQQRRKAALEVKMQKDAIARIMTDAKNNTER